MSEYNLGTARGQISIDGSAGAKGFAIAQGAGEAFFSSIQAKVEEVQQLGKRLAAVGAAGVAGFGVAVKSASGFEAQIDAIAAVTGSAGKELEDLRNLALKLGADTSFSAGEAASALEELVKAGVSVEDVLNGAADATTALAAAGGLGIPQAATIAANAMNQFGVAGDQAAHVADVLAGAANASSADVETLGTSLSQVGAVANLAGLSLDDTVKALGQFANKGIQGSDAGTSLKTMLTNLIPTTDAQIAKFQELGLITYDAEKAMRILRSKGIEPTGESLIDSRAAVIEYLKETKGLKDGTAKLTKETDKFLLKQGVMSNEFFDAQGNIKDLRSLQDILAKSTEYLADGTTKMTKEEKLKNLEILFGTDAMRAAAIAALSGAEGYDEFSDSMEGITAAEVAEKRLDNLHGAMEQLSGAAETLAIKVGTPLLKPLTSLVNTVANVIAKVAALPDPVLKVFSVLGILVSGFLLVTGAILALLPLIAAFIVNMIAMKLIRLAIAPLMGFAKAMLFNRSVAGAAAAANTRFAASVATVGRYSKVAAIGMRLFALAVRLLMFTLSGPGAIIVGLIALMVLLYKKNEAFRNIVNSVGSAVKSFLIATFERAKVAVQQLMAFYSKLAGIFQSEVLPVIKKVGQELLGKLVAAGQKLWSQIQSQLVPAIMDLVGVFQTISNSSFGDKLREWGAAAAGLGAKILPVLAKIQIFFVSKILPALVKVAGFFGGVLIDTITSAISGIIKVITGFVNIVTGIVKVFKGLFTGDWALMWEGVKQIFTGAFQAILGAIQTWLAVGVLKLFRLGFTLIRGIVAAGWSVIKSLFSAAGSVIVNLATLPFRLIVAAIRASISIVRAIISASLNFVRAVFSRIFGGLRGIVGGAMSGIRGIISGAIGAVRGFFSGGFGALTGIVRGALGRVVGAIKGAASNTFNAAKNIVTKVKEAFTGAVGDFAQIGRDMIAGLIGGIGEMARKAADKAKSVVGGALSGAKKILRIGSPSKVFHQIGVWTIQGFVNGMDRQHRNVERSITNLAGIVTSGAVDNMIYTAGTYGGVGGSRADTSASLPGVVSAPAATVNKNKEGDTMLKLIDGQLGIDPSGQAWIRGQAREVDMEQDEFNKTLVRMGSGDNAY